MNARRENFENQWMEQEYHRLCGENVRLKDDAQERLKALEEIYWLTCFQSSTLARDICLAIEPILKKAGKLPS